MSGWTPIRDEAEFRARFVGRSLQGDGLRFTLQSDGTVSGIAGGEGFSGKWSWSEGHFIRRELDGVVDDGHVEEIEGNGVRMRYRRIDRSDWQIVAIVSE